jgi:hypothetical protein
MAQAIPFIASTLATVGGGSGAAVTAGNVALGTAKAVGAAAAVGGTAASIQQGRRAQRAQEKADEVSRAQTAIANQRSIRQNILRSRAAQAQLISQGQAQTGSFGGSSSVQGALGAAQTQQAANLGFARQTQAASGAINRQIGRANQAQSRAGTFGAVAGLPAQFGFDLRSIFEGN